MVESVIQLKCNCNNYPWGKVGKESLAARLCASIPGNEFTPSSSEHYAELWMGTYPVNPSYVLSTGEDLQDVLDANREKLIGQTVLDKFGSKLPMLPKILSMEKALPLQIHPDIELSKKLHAKDPKQFSDTNHKPEISICLTEFEAFAGFREQGEIERLLELEPLKQFVPEDVHSFDKETVRQVCKNMLVASESTVASAIEALEKFPADAFGKHTQISKLLPRLRDQYGKTDNGSLVALILMNYYNLEPGEAIWVPADGIHAWLYGDIVECMARSDNVLNTGFCPRADRDSVDTFVEALTFKLSGEKDPLLPRSDSEFTTSGKTTAFKPPLSEFNMLVSSLKSGESDTIKPIAGPSIAFVTTGKGTMQAIGKQYEVSAGHVFFIGQNTEVKLESSTDDFAMYRAYAE